MALGLLAGAFVISVITSAYFPTPILACFDRAGAKVFAESSSRELAKVSTNNVTATATTSTVPKTTAFESLTTILQNNLGTLLTLVTTAFLAWYVNYAVKKRLYSEELTERRLKDLYRPMQIMLTASKLSFERYLSSSDKEEQKSIAELWNSYNNEMKKMIMSNSHLFVESDLPPEIVQLIKHIDAYSFDYNQYKQGKLAHPFPGARGFPFPKNIEGYFASRSSLLAKQLQSNSSWRDRLGIRKKTE
jgi:hypothetical protein